MLALLHGPAARIEEVVDRRERERRPYSFVLALGDDVYKGFERTTRHNVAARLEADQSERGRPVLVQDFTFRKTSLERLRGHKNFCRTEALHFLTQAERAGLGKSIIGATGER